MSTFSSHSFSLFRANAPILTHLIVSIPSVAKICHQYDVFHLVNNAYGLQSSKSSHLINEALRDKEARLDAFVQSTDKNFMVPVGGSIIASTSSDTLRDISQTYPGRATSSPIVDLFITLLSMGRKGYLEILNDRKRVYKYFKEQLSSMASKFGEKVIETPSNQISIAMTLDTLAAPSTAATGPDTSTSAPSATKSEDKSREPTMIGAMLFNSCTSGIRVVAPGKVQKVNGHRFLGYGSHHNTYPHIYLTVAAAVGMSIENVDLTIKRLAKTLTKASKRLKDNGTKESSTEAERSEK